MGLPSPLEYPRSLQFCFLELRTSFLCSSLFLFHSSFTTFSRSPAEISSNSLRYRACSLSLPSLSDRRAPTGTSSISHLPRSRFDCKRLFSSAIFKCLPHFGKESSLFVPSFPFFVALPRPSPFVVSLRPFADFPRHTLCVHRCVLR